MSNDFSSLDRLMELGLSMAVAQQMIGTMNHAIKNAQAPGAGAPMNKPEPVKYFVVVDSAQAGPFSGGEMEDLVKKGRLTPQTLIWKAGMPSWKYAEEVSEINKLFLLFTEK